LRSFQIARAAVSAALAFAITFTSARNAVVALIAVLAYLTAMVAIEIFDAFKSGDSMLRGTVLRISLSIIALSTLISASFTRNGDELKLTVINLVILGYGFTAISFFKMAKAPKQSRARTDLLIIALLNVFVLAFYGAQLLKWLSVDDVTALGAIAAYGAIQAVLIGISAFDPRTAG